MSKLHNLQVPGFTHTVTDVYLDEILPLIGYQSSGSFSDKHSNKPGKQADLSPEVQAAIDGAIFETFLDASEDSFDRLLEVPFSPQKWLKLHRD